MSDRTSNPMSLGKAIRLAEAAFQQKFSREIDAASNIDKSWFNGYIEALISDPSPVETTGNPWPEYTNAIGDAGYQYMQRCDGRISSGFFYWHQLWDVLNLAAAQGSSEEPSCRAGVSVKDPTPPQEIVLCAAPGPSGFICERPKGHPGRHCDGDNRRWDAEKAPEFRPICAHGNFADECPHPHTDCQVNGKPEHE